MNKTNWEKRFQHVLAQVTKTPLGKVEVHLAKSKFSDYFIATVTIRGETYVREAHTRDMLFEEKCELLAQLAHTYSDVDEVHPYNRNDWHSEEI